MALLAFVSVTGLVAISKGCDKPEEEEVVVVVEYHLPTVYVAL